ncbi:DUF3060 domain-containing protein [Mycobacterium sp. RTGN5]|uniref:DUF3060 domain-containing protein n=1 Tax=Mycobacterium sp. RTGN5 TaxID=3016522 RepID=UPI0029C6AE4C|nr:DUF3060 domain-containing protein [Mycobacterium sp. RTGN5]
MNPDDDPEKRIQELERSLTNQAQTSELGTSGPPGSWPPPPPPIPPMPPAYYGPPIPPPSVPSPSSGIRIGWIVLALLVVGLFVGGGAIVWSNLSNRSAPGFPSSSGSGGTLTPGARPSRNTPIPPGPSSPPAPGGSVTVSGANADKTIVCNDSIVTISGMANTVSITGHCRSVEVSGMNNVVAIDVADTINASGMDNKVTYRAGAPKITKSGFDNTVEAG